MSGLVVPAFFPLDAASHGRSPCPNTEAFSISPYWSQIEQAGNPDPDSPLEEVLEERLPPGPLRDELEGLVSIVVPDGSFNSLTGSSLTLAQAQFDRCRQRGELILGYVTTNSGQYDPWQDIANWYKAYTDSAGTHIDGIFFDVGPVIDNVATQSWYTKLLDGFKRSYPAPYNFVFLNASQFTNEWVMQVADCVILWEKSLSDYLTSYQANNETIPPWWMKWEYRSRIAHVVYDAPCRSRTQIQNFLQLSESRNAGLVYLFDGYTAKYDHLPSYWSDEVLEVLATRTEE